MKNLLTPGRTLAATLLLGWLGCAGAQSLGSPAASVWIGQPLEMTVPARFGAGDGDECVHADVFYGDHRLPPQRVRATVVGTQDNRRVRIEAQSLVDEPIVTVTVRAGCRNTITRSYTLLPDMPSESVLAAAARPAFAVAGGPAGALPGLRMDAPASMARAAPRARPAATTLVAASDTAQPSSVVRRQRVSLRREAAVEPGPRLRLDAVDLDARTLLRVSATLADPAGDAARRATAALLWQAINADPSELLRTSAMLQKLETDLAQLRQSATQTRSEMTALRQRIDDAKPWYASSGLLQVLALLVLAAGTGVAVLWYRTRHAQLAGMPWFSPERREPADSVLDSSFGPSGQGAEAVAAPRVVPQEVPAPAKPAQPAVVPAPVRAKPMFGKASKGAAAAAAATATAAAAAAAAASRPQVPVVRRASTGALRVETLAATFEEVEFLASLGLTTDAMDVLKAYL
ncbi:MAG TPA: hypothetical protein VHL79_02865, partial [Ramlibacter sp.]|nr:hypothetical protein [Ramlibacter sp.]